MLSLIEQVSDLAAIKIPSDLIRSERLVSTGHLIQIETRAGPPSYCSIRMVKVNIDLFLLSPLPILQHCAMWKNIFCRSREIGKNQYWPGCPKGSFSAEIGILQAIRNSSLDTYFLAQIYKFSFRNEITPLHCMHFGALLIVVCMY